MVLFNHALDHLIRIHRTLRIERGHVLLIGSSGNGKKSLSKLAAFTSGNAKYSIICIVNYKFNIIKYVIKLFIRYMLLLKLIENVITFPGYEICMNTLFGSNCESKINKQKFIIDIKNIFFKVGIKNRPVVFIIDKVDAIEDEGIV